MKSLVSFTGAIKNHVSSTETVMNDDNVIMIPLPTEAGLGIFPWGEGPRKWKKRENRVAETFSPGLGEQRIGDNRCVFSLLAATANRISNL